MRFKNLNSALLMSAALAFSACNPLAPSEDSGPSAGSHRPASSMDLPPDAGSAEAASVQAAHTGNDRRK